MGKIANLMEASFAGLTDVLEFRRKPTDLKYPPPTDTTSTERQGNFRSFLIGDKQNRTYLFIATFCLIIQFAFFKVVYPLPDFISDSYSYIDTNLYHMKVNLWPIGYSKYLALIHLITPSDTFLVFSQFLILEASFLYFFYSFIYLYNISKNYINILFIFLFFNPLFLYLSNCVLSDTIFCTLSTLLFTEYLWMFKTPRKRHIYGSALLIGILFTLRYTAICYPFIAAVAFILSKQSLIRKLIGIIMPWLLIVPFILYTQQKTKEITGTPEFSVFGGWQIANNALYMYDHIKVDTTQLPPKTLQLDRMARKYFRDVPPEFRQLEPLPGTFFIKVQRAILKPYLLERYHVDDAPSQFFAWGKVSPIYKEYGEYLIKKYPVAFAKYYLWLNTKNYFIPHLEKFGNYNLGMDSLYDVAKVWFHLKNTAVTGSAAPDFQSHVFYFYPVAFMMVNLYFAGSFLFLLLSGKLKSINKMLKAGILLAVFTLLINFGFSIFATPVVLRYQVFPMILLVGFSLYLTELLDKKKPSL